MILKPTVLILGAGASKPYGYPLGKTLVQRILDLTKSGTVLWSVLTGGYRSEQLHQFRNSLQDSKPASIDDFLEANEGFRELGRVCITAALTVFGPRRDEVEQGELDWLEYLWWRLHNDAPTSAKFASNQLKVITYNYDSSFERYFATVLSAFYSDLRKRHSNADAFRDAVLPTVHVHGSLGPFLEEVRSLANPLDRNQITWYRRAANAIRILSEGDHAVEYGKAHEWIREADVIYLLGFGYHQTNTNRLDLRRQLTETAPAHPDRIVKGTALGIGEAELNDIVRRLNVDAEIQLRGHGLLFPQDARTFLETHGLA